MLALNTEQTQALEAIKRRRDLQALQAALAEQFPELAARAGERFEALVAHGAERSVGHGLSHVVCIARFLACWSVLGADFETREDCGWARTLLAERGRPQGSRIYQLCRRARETLAQPRPGLPGEAAFDAALHRLDALLMPRGEFTSLLPVPRLKLGQRCDIDQLELAWQGPATQHYRLDRGQWLRSPLPAPAALVIGAEAPATLALHALGQPAGSRELARLHLRSRAAHICDPASHPLLAAITAQGIAEWRGPLAEPARIPLIAEPQPDGLAVPGATALAQLGASACGLRDTGSAFGSRALTLHIHAASQQLLVWQRSAAGTPARVRHERDGQPLDGNRWLAALAELDRQVGAGLQALASAWARESGVSQAQADYQPRIMLGSAGLAWGLRASATLTEPPKPQLAGLIDLVACHLELRLGGRLELQGARSQLALHCASEDRLRIEFGAGESIADPAALLERAQARIRQPFALQAEALAGEASGTLMDVASPPSGAIVGACGLRARADAPGLEWFCELAVEPVRAQFVVNDPLLGSTTVILPLLPAMKLVHWSMA